MSREVEARIETDYFCHINVGSFLNDELCVLDEKRFVGKRFPKVEPSRYSRHDKPGGLINGFSVEAVGGDQRLECEAVRILGGELNNERVTRVGFKIRIEVLMVVVCV